MLEYTIHESDAKNYTDTPIMVVRVGLGLRVMSSSNYNVLYILLVAVERMDQIKWWTDSKVAPKDL